MLGTIIQASAVFIAAISVAYNASSWRRAFVGQRKIELAEQVFEEFHKAGDAIRDIRNRFGVLGEGGSRKRDVNESAELSEALDAAFVTIERYSRHSDLFSELFSRKFRFSVYFGKETAALFEELKEIVDDVLGAARKVARLSRRDIAGRNNERQTEKIFKQLVELDAILWLGGGEGGFDPIQERLELLLRKVDGVCRQEIDSQLSGSVSFRVIKRRIGYGLGVTRTERE